MILAGVLFLGFPGLVEWQKQRTALMDAVQEDLVQLTAAIDEDRWPEARVALGRAEARLGDGGPDSLRARVQEQRRNLDMVASLEKAQLTPSLLSLQGKGSYRRDYRGSDQAYAAAFAAFHLDLKALETQEVVQRIQGSGIRRYILRALDHWAFVKSQIPNQSPTLLWALASQADDDPWRRQVREAWSTRNRQALERLAEDPRTQEQPAVNLYVLGISLQEEPEGWRVTEKLFRKGLRRYPGDFWINLDLGFLVSSAYEGSRFPVQAAEAVGFLGTALALRPQSPDIHSQLGCALYNQGKLAEAVEELNQALQINPHFPEAHNNLGIVLSHQGKRREAIEEFHKALQINPNDEKAHYNLGLEMYDQGKLPEAVEGFRKALQINPHFSEAHSNLGSALSRLEKLTEAMKEYRQALQINPNNAQAHNNLANALGSQGKLAEATEEYRKALQINPNYSNAHYNLGKTLLDLGKVPEAVEELRRALQIDPKKPMAHYVLGIVLYNQGKRTEAMEEFRKAIKAYPAYPEAHHNLGIVLADQGKWAEAVAEYRQALKAQPNDAKGHTNLGNALFHQGKQAEALEEFRRALQINPHYAPARNALSQLVEPLPSPGEEKSR